VTEVRFFPGTEQTVEILLDAEDTGGALSLMRLRMPPGAGAPRHRHRLEAETLVVTEGELWVELEGQERVLAAGEAIHLSVGSLHAFRSDPGAVVDVIATPAGLEEFFRVVCTAEPNEPPPADEDVRIAFERAGLDFSGV
jgi:quercetin dioxygenase-like cupin family protein